LSFWRFAKQYLLSPVLGLSVDLKSYGPWAVVTGSTDGIGKAYALELAKQGLNIVLISRSVDKLKAVAEEIESTFHVKTKCVPVDFTGGPEIYDSLRVQLSELEIGVLVNNVGVSHNLPHFFAEIADEQELRTIINVNCHSVTFMSKMLLGQMVERKRGIIINISSASGVFPTPLLAVYSGTKAFVDFFSRALDAEYKSKGIIVQSITPGFVATKLSKLRSTSFLIASPSRFVLSALATVGVATRTPGWWTHAIQIGVSGMLPEWLYSYVSMKFMMPARKRGLAKLQKKE
jgi:17beta-estradiol 17-dehydrogenase / very-long-chain 3-oxoacyl-CoA reductase